MLNWIVKPNFGWLSSMLASKYAVISRVSLIVYPPTAMYVSIVPLMHLNTCFAIIRRFSDGEAANSTSFHKANARSGLLQFINYPREPIIAWYLFLSASLGLHLVVLSQECLRGSWVKGMDCSHSFHRVEVSPSTQYIPSWVIIQVWEKLQISKV